MMMMMESAAEVISYDATVVTGMERLAIKECRAKIAVVDDIQHSLGHVYIKSTDRYDKLRKLHSVDNIYVSVFSRDDLSLVDADSAKLREAFSQAIEESNWKQGIDVWMSASGFQKCDLATILDRKADDDKVKPSFRVTCNRTGNQKFTSPEASCVFGGLINDTFHWPVSLKNFDIEILLTVKEKALSIAICLTKESLYKRYIVDYGITSLRGTIAYNIIQTADIQPGDIVCDPLCGSGVIPVEAAISWPEAFVLAGDNNSVAIGKTFANCAANKLEKSTNILQWDATRMPLKDGVVDVFITDLPFGRRLGSKQINKTLYPPLLEEMVRCVRPGTGRIVLLTQDKTNANRVMGDPVMRKYLKLEWSYFVKVGNLDSSIYLLKRNGSPFERM